ncbi:MAG: von Willebrand factor type A domain-containing protein [Nonlabens sp.]
MKQFALLIALVTMTLNCAQGRNIKGIVTDQNDDPIFGAIVKVRGSQLFVQTDFNGEYRIKATEGDTLLFQYTGYNKQEIEVQKQCEINVKLCASLNEVVIVGYKKIKSNNIAAVTTVTTQVTETKGAPTIRSRENIHSLENTSIIQKLQGQVPGITVVPEMDDKEILHHPRDYGYLQKGENYSEIVENQFELPQNKPLSTFSIDVDKASYSNVRRFINNGQAVPVDAVKIEEMINYFDYDYDLPTGGTPFSVMTEVFKNPWNRETNIVRIGLKGKSVSRDELPASSITFLIDVSGSMNNYNKLPLLKKAFRLLVDQLRPQDQIAIVVYAGAAGTVLEPTCGDQKNKILESLENLRAGGATAGSEGIELAYEIAQKNFIKSGNNRVIMATDGDFNVGQSSTSSLKELITSKRDSGISLSVIGFGMGNYQDAQLETLADHGNGNHAYIDTMQEAEKVFVQEFNGTMHLIAKDVKLQVEFNPTNVAGYRLIGYENRLLQDQDFRDDKKDAGELGMGHTVTALYEIIPKNSKSKYLSNLPILKYSTTTANSNLADLCTVKLRYKEPDGSKSKLLTYVQENKLAQATTDGNFATSVPLFGMILRKSSFTNQASYKDVIALAEKGRGNDEAGYRAEFLRLVKIQAGQDQISLVKKD